MYSHSDCHLPLSSACAPHYKACLISELLGELFHVAVGVDRGTCEQTYHNRY